MPAAPKRAAGARPAAAKPKAAPKAASKAIAGPARDGKKLAAFGRLLDRKVAQRIQKHKADRPELTPSDLVLHKGFGNDSSQQAVELPVKKDVSRFKRDHADVNLMYTSMMRPKTFAVSCGYWRFLGLLTVFAGKWHAYAIINNGHLKILSLRFYKSEMKARGWRLETGQTGNVKWVYGNGN